MNKSKSSNKLSNLLRPSEGQSLVEFAMVIPVLMLIMFGTIEFGRLFFIYSNVNAAVREAGRYGISIGQNANPPHYLDCAGIAATANNAVLLTPVNVTIGYDNGGTVYRGDCTWANTQVASGTNPIQVGDRILITATVLYMPLVPLVNIPTINIRASTARTIIRGIGFDQSLPQPPPGCFLLTVDVDPFVGGIIVESGGTQCPTDNRFYKANTTVTLNAFPSSVHFFDYWRDDAVAGACAPVAPGSECNVATVTMTENKSAVAVFDTVLPCLFLTTSVNPPGSGSVAANTPHNCEENFRLGWVETTVVQLQASANTGFSFVDWAGDATGLNNPENLVMTGGDKSVTANFVANTCNSLSVIVNPVAGGTYNIVPPQDCPGGWTAGTAITLTASANTGGGYTFLSWTGAISSTNPVASMTMNSNEVVNLNFNTALACHSLGVTPQPSIGGSASALPFQNCSGGWITGTLVTLYASPNLGYGFSSWAGPVTITSTTPTQVLMDANKSVIVNFSSTGNDMAIVKTATSSAAVGEPITYTLRVINNGSVIATNVTVQDILPSRVTYTGYSSLLGSCTESGGIITCNLGTMPAGPSTTDVYIYADATQAGIATNSASVTAFELDPFLSNNSDSADTFITQPTDIAITESGPMTVTQGNPMTYTLTITNNGPVQATGVRVIDTLPPEVQFVSFSSQLCTYNQNNAEVFCNLGTMANGDTQTIDIQVIPVTISIPPGPTILSAIQDTYIDSFSGNSLTARRDDLNYNGSNIQVHAQSNQDTFGLIEFDLSPFTGTVQSALLELDVILDGLTTVDVYVINGPWNESIVTYNNFVNNYNAITSYGSASIAASGKLSIDITSLVQGWVSSSINNYGLLLKASGNNMTWEFSDKENTPATKLIITPVPVVNRITNVASVLLREADSDTTNNSDSLDTTVNVGSSFITAEPNCGESGVGISVNGYNWQASQYGQAMDILFEFSENPSNSTTLFSSAAYTPTSSLWTETITVPVGTIDDYHTIRAQHGVIDVTARLLIPCPKPNLIAGQPVLVGTQPITVAAPVQFNVAITNVGSLAAISQFPVGLYLNPVPAPVIGTTYISQSFRSGISHISGLTVGQTRSLTFTVNSGLPYSGTHDIYAVVDSDPSLIGKIQERSETDNLSPPLSVLAAGPTPVPTPTPIPYTTTATIFGGAFIIDVGTRLPQENVRVNLFDEAGPTYIGTEYTNNLGSYIFHTVGAPTTYTITGCVNVDGEDYYYSVSGLPVTAGSIVQVDLILQKSLCGP